MNRIILVVPCLLALLLAACTGQQLTVPATAAVVPASPTVRVPSPTALPATPTRAPTATASPTAEPASTPRPAAEAAILAQWRTSPHGNTYDLGKGPNTYCARCHSPQNWDTAAKVDPPPNCVSCKFPTDATVRIAQSNRLVSPSDWKNIGCEVCHRVENGLASSVLVWSDKATGKTEVLDDSNALCIKCHLDSDVLRHRRDLGKSTHIAFRCTQCHDAHTTQADCASGQCHTSVTKVDGHDAAHAAVNCATCHDSSGLPVGPDNQTKKWVTWRTTEAAGRKTTALYAAHNLQKTVDCARCHFAGNNWGLSATVR